MPNPNHNLSIHCGILDADIGNQEKLSHFIDKVPFLSLKETYTSPLEADSSQSFHLLDVVFINSDLPYISGLDWIVSKSIPPKFVLLSKELSDAAYAFDNDALDFIYDLNFTRFYKAANKIKRSKDARYSVASSKSLFVKSENRINKIPFDDIIFIEAQNNYIHINTKKKKYTTLMKLKEAEAILPQHQFIRIQKSIIVNKSFVQAIEGNAVVVNENLFNISRPLKKKVIASITQGYLV
ncbi:response regulator transcription factor [Flammeovirga sp. MY04]|uniref:LytR/AlgR family response regulator transcription factor n=1 Tax=Flammeovirga sp. MY04 TaxID=1191459 RepID=UPI0008060A34|nr:LytTR family DNA-binding domain-containing protein [Flammeovirga sp. MY04]ANQ48170.1 response regulator transcription factor [Flammeovirga sp. MY04]